ncbi:Adenylate kinase [Georgenia satyanarayanai]|uniref:Adenylate kinase n=1 Tax=Georgenia satyanarayanai TaxID=860221 RepID=A0A2Y9AN98_9MICO|nr:AAA family ATPase [Georgenia satyanarayanai]PYF97796.1 adenylate kinase family enzyme [Georgenia satyanarayanai]SSA45536.1 Adenylate kinase [Georgenia satyanarayanai]
MLRHDDPLPHRPRRVLVAGVSGAGKTTLARRVAAVTGGPHTEIDALFHGPGWVPRTEFLDDVRALVARDAWTTEWQYTGARPLLAERADLLVWLDLAFATVTLPRLLRRTVGRRLRRQELWNGNVEPPLWTVLTDREHVVRWAVHTRGKLRVRVPLLEEHEPHLVVVRLRSPREVKRWVEGALRAAVAASSG